MSNVDLQAVGQGPLGRTGHFDLTVCFEEDLSFVCVEALEGSPRVVLLAVIAL